jgi:hypothetical protein
MSAVIIVQRDRVLCATMAVAARVVFVGVAFSFLLAAVS